MYVSCPAGAVERKGFIINNGIETNKKVAVPIWYRNFAFTLHSKESMSSRRYERQA